GSFPMSWLFVSSGQSFGGLASALVLPMNIQGSFTLGNHCFTMLLVSAVQQSKSDLCIHISSLSFGFPSHLGHHRALSRSPCAIQ
ncbi:hypothetical protein Q6284_32330, partial [Klebsiella pneumoniae]|uniref:hypothetical protein n=1 Tax=Klebsiella pneumoniae TaxID=573 RepID=UPI00272FB8E3